MFLVLNIFVGQILHNNERLLGVSVISSQFFD